MKRLPFAMLLILMLAACQIANTTPAPSAVTVPAATSTPSKAVSKGITTPAALVATPTPSGPVVHKSSSDTNASNLIIVSDQFTINNSLTIDSITAAQAGWVVLYLDKQGRSGGLQFGPAVVYAPIPAGKSNHFVIPLNQNFNPSVNPSTLPGTPLDVVLQTNPSNPNTMLRNNNAVVWVKFTILTNNKVCTFCAVLTATP